MAKPEQEKANPMADELVAIKRLLIFGLLRDGASQAEVAAALGVNQSSVSRMFPGRLAGGSKPIRRSQK